MNYSDADYAKFPGLVRPRKVQTPRPKVSLRYPWKCATIEDVRAELVKCPEGFRGALALESDHASDIIWLEGMKKHPSASESDKADLQQSIDWLRGAPRRVLSIWWRQRYRRKQTAWRLRRLGVPFPEGERQERYERRNRENKLKQHAYREKLERRKLPDWMTDSSKLPKAPPGR